MKSSEPITPAYFDLKGASEYLGKGLSVKRLRKALAEPDGLPHHRVGGKILVSKDDLDLWLSRFRREPVSLDSLVERALADFHKVAPNKNGKRKKPRRGQTAGGKEDKMQVTFGKSLNQIEELVNPSCPQANNLTRPRPGGAS